ERRLLVFQIAEHRVAEDDFAVARLIARSAARLGSGSRQIDQPAGITDWQGTEKDLVEDGEDGDVRADSKGERRERHCADKRGLEEGSERKGEIEHPCFALDGSSLSTVRSAVQLLRGSAPIRSVCHRYQEATKR